MSQIVCISGGSTGIGLGLVDGFLDRNAKVYTFARDEKKGNELKKRQEKNHRLHVMWGDVSDNNFRIRLVKEIKENQGKLDVLINNAGVFDGEGGDIDETINAWNTMLQVNLIGAFALTQALYPLLLKSDNPSVINISSACSLGVFHTCGSVAYSASKAGLDSLTQHLAQRLGTDGIRVNSINPGVTQTPIWEGTDPAYVETILKEKHILKGAMIQPSDIAEAALFLSSQQARYITGALLPVDSGYSIS